MRPRGPEPEIWLKSRPFCWAMRFASGLANRRSPDACAETGLGAAAAGRAMAATSTGAATAAGAASAVISPALSPSSSNTAMVVLTNTPSVPSATRILPNTPSSTASTSIVALSVSISQRISPLSTTSPSDFIHLAKPPSVIVGDRAGIKI